MKALDSNNLETLRKWLCRTNISYKVGYRRDIDAFDLFINLIKRCPYCGGVIDIVPASEFFKKDDYSGFCYVCRNCRSYCNAVRGTNIPSGVISNTMLRNHHKMIYSLYQKLESCGEDTQSINNEICSELEISGLEACRINYMGLDNCIRVEKKLKDILSRYEDSDGECGLFEVFI